MKKVFFAFVATAALVVTACNNSKSTDNSTTTTTTDTSAMKDAANKTAPDTAMKPAGSDTSMAK